MLLIAWPEPKERPLSRSMERACSATMGAGVALLIPATITEGSISRQLLIASMACIVTVGPPLVYQVVQSIRWIRRSET